MRGTGFFPCRASIVPAPRRAEAQTRRSRDHLRPKPGIRTPVRMPPAPLALLAPTAVRALLALVAIPTAFAFDALFLHAELVSVAIGVVLAFPDTFVLLAN